MSRLRVRAFTRRVPAPHGYIGWEDERVQQLQTAAFGGWRVVDEEIVPEHVVIALGCCGDTGGWTSKFAGLGSFGRDGVIQ